MLLDALYADFEFEALVDFAVLKCAELGVDAIDLGLKAIFGIGNGNIVGQIVLADHVLCAARQALKEFGKIIAANRGGQKEAPPLTLGEK